jgi:hypothetical protein
MIHNTREILKMDIYYPVIIILIRVRIYDPISKKAIHRWAIPGKEGLVGYDYFKRFMRLPEPETLQAFQATQGCAPT